MKKVSELKIHKHPNIPYRGMVENSPSLAVIDIPIDAIKPAEYNPRKITEYQFEALKRSIMEYGFLQPIIVNKKTNTIIAGHQRYEAYKILGRKTIPAILIDHLDENREKALNLALNRISGTWDADKLANIIQNMGAEILNISGFEAPDIDDILTQLKHTTEEAEKKTTKTEHIPAKEIKIYQLGPHKLAAGDSTRAETYKALIDKPAHMVFTDPPYNVNYRSRATGDILNDNMKQNAFRAFLSIAIHHVKHNTTDTASIYICFNYANIHLLYQALESQGLDIKANIIWCKERASFGATTYYAHQYENIVFATKKNQTSYFAPIIKRRPGENPTDVWQIKRKQATEYLHPNEKPVELIKKAIINSSRQNEIILDPFAGSGSTLEACHKTGRIFYGIEYDEKYVETIIKRWEKIKSLPG